MINTTRNISVETVPGFSGVGLLLGDSLARAGRLGTLHGEIMRQIDDHAGLSQSITVANAAWGGFRLYGVNGDGDNFLDIADDSNVQQAMTDTITIMDAHDPVDFVIVSLGTKDLAYVEGGSLEISGYNEAKIESGMAALVDDIRTENQANGGTGAALPIIVMVPGRDQTVAKLTPGSVWRKAMIDFCASDANVHQMDIYDVSIYDSVHPDEAGNKIIGFRAGLLAAKNAYSVSSIDGPPSIASVSKVDNLTMRVNFTVPSGQIISQPGFPASWRVEDASQNELKIRRIDWIDSNEANLVLFDATSGAMTLKAPYATVPEFNPDGVIRTDEGGDDNEPGFVLNSFEGTTP